MNHDITEMDSSESIKPPDSNLGSSLTFSAKELDLPYEAYDLHKSKALSPQSASILLDHVVRLANSTRRMR